MIRRRLAILAVAVVVTSCHSHGSMDLSVANPTPTRTKEILWTSKTNIVKYAISIVEQGAMGAEVSLTIKNVQGDPIYLLDSQPWEVTMEQRTVTASWGNRVFLYGSELPAMTRIGAGETVAYRDVIQLPADHNEINFFVVGFHCICGRSSIIEKELDALDVVDGWWQGADASLADRFLSLLVKEEVSFYNLPLKP